jgi:tetratricopeptide (TPR) repeat protein
MNPQPPYPVTPENSRVQTFFLSYAKADRECAEWNTGHLEAAGHRVISQASDFRPGQNFLVQINAALLAADQTIALLSAAYEASAYCTREWTAAVVLETEGRHRLLPVRIEAHEISPLLKPINYIDLVGLDPAEAKARLLEGIDPAKHVRATWLSGSEPHFSYPRSEATVTRTAVRVGRPPRTHPLFGRQEEVDTLVRNICTRWPLPTPILGAPGIGKSAVCIAALHQPTVQKYYGPRRYFARCNGARTAEAAVMVIASSLGLRAAEGDPLPQVRTALAEAPTVLVLDNAETPWEADSRGTVELLEELAAIEELALVATIKGRVRPPRVPWLEPIELNRLEHEHARGLFLREAGQKHADDPHLDPLVREQDGVPLTITLLAWQARKEDDLAPLWTRWQRERGALLQKGLSEINDVNAEVTFELAINSPRTTSEGRRLLALLGVLPDGIARSDVEILLPAVGEDAAASLRGVWLASYEEGRVRTLQPIGDYVRRKYKPATDDLARAGAHYRQIGEQLGRQSGGRGGADASARLSAEIGNIDAVLQLGLEEPDPRPSIDTAISIGSFMRFSGLGSTLLLDAAVDAARRVGDLGREAQAMKAIGDVSLVRANHDVAESRYRAAQEHFVGLEDLEGQARCVMGLGHLARAQGRRHEAGMHYDAARRLFTDAGVPVGEADAMAGLADVAFDGKDVDEAYRLYQQAQPLYRAEGHTRGVANCIADLGEIALARNELHRARQLFEEAMPLYVQVGHLHGMAKCERGLADVCLEEADHNTAEIRYRTAQELYLQVGARKEEAWAAAKRGDAARAAGNEALAQALFSRALAIFVAIGDRSGTSLMMSRTTMMSRTKSSASEK